MAITAYRAADRDNPLSPRHRLAAALWLWLGQGPGTGKEIGLEVRGTDASPDLRGSPIISKTHFSQSSPYSLSLCLFLPSSPSLPPTSHFPLGNVKVQDAEIWANDAA